MPHLHDRLAAALRDRYRIEREVGAGGMATVFLAQDLKHDRQVALKVLRPELGAVLGGERFLREIQIAARIQHPHVLALLDSGEADGLLYYVMPFVRGESLRDRLGREGKLPIADVIRMLRDVADGLAEAHRQGLVHRDVKPDNVLISGNHAVVTDFGVAKAATTASGPQALTTAGVALGTPAYMSPEQVTAETTIDHRTDIYALGVMGYELLAGRPPFLGATAQEVLVAHLASDPEPVTGPRPDTPPALAQLIMTCLAKQPADRWQSTDEVLQRLEAMTTPSGGNGNSSQDPNTYSGKVLRLNDDGTAPADNPFVGRTGHKPEIYTLGHRNSLGLAVHPGTGEMWQNEMGPNGGDEINILKPGGQLRLAHREPRPELSRTVAVADVLERRVRVAGRLLDAVHFVVRHDVLYRQQASEVEGRYLRGRTTDWRDPRDRPPGAHPRQREAGGAASRVAAPAARDAHPRRASGP